MTPQEARIFFGVMSGAALLLGAVFLANLLRRAPPPIVVRGGAGSDLSFAVVRLGIDWRARREVQEGLAQLARTADPSTRPGRAKLLREVSLALTRAQMSWLYASFACEAVQRAQAEARFRAAGVDARGRYRREVIRKADGALQEAAPAAPLAPRADEGQGTVVVTLVVVVRRPLLGAASARDAGTLRAALLDLGAVSPDDLIALEVVWSPAVEADRMSTAELEQHYPELGLIDPASVAGRTFCAFCTGPYPRELLACPHCGAPGTPPAG